uniref:phage tail protein n=1 Tax=Sphingopyxis sp. KK2 TaxID=1855727 RepID=UPI001C4DECCF
MATLVLTVVGGILGGPVGAAIGAAVGQQIDAEIFKPKGREGPRLADLKVQASTYGQQIPKLFGTMRVAGSVIWATDLIERREKHGGGKGRPSTTEYSYSVSLAVALSSRPVRAIRRIWADGDLLRGTSGTFQERCIFRWYDGSEDQPVDPLIASALGIGAASAFRGLSYAVFEELELARFGNRIPALNFEVEADAGTIDAGLVGAVLLGEAGRCAGRTGFSGYAASGDRVREALAPLLDADDVRLVSAPGGWRLAPTALAGAPVALADFSEARRVPAAPDGAETRRAPLAALPGTIRLRHYEPERDYQLGQQAALVAGGGRREEKIDLPAVLSAGGARALARRIAADVADGRETRVWRGDLAALALPVGGLVTVAGPGSGGGAWRVVSRTVKDSEVR